MNAKADAAIYGDPDQGRVARYTHALMVLTRTVWHDDCTLSRAFDVICRTAASTLDVPRVNIWKLDEAGNKLVCLHAFDSAATDGAGAGVDETIELEGPYSGALEQVRVVDATNVATSPATAERGLQAYFSRHGICSVLDAPVRLEGDLLGVICSEQTGKIRPWQAEEKTFAGSMGDYVAMAIEIQRRRETEKELEHLRLHDSTTDLPNRQYFLELLQLRMRAPRTPEQVIAVVHVKSGMPYTTIQSSEGPTAEDAMLAVANALRQRVGIECSIARVRADGFALLPQRQCGEFEVVTLAQQCSEIVQDLSPWHDAIELSGAVGLALVHESDGINARELMRRAEQAADRASQRGRHSLEVFDVEHHHGLVERLHLEKALRDALANDAFEMHYQPEFDGLHNAWSAAEALVRWRRGDELLTAAAFMDVAETSSLILPLGRWILRRACRDAMDWPLAADGEALTLRVNVSAQQFEDRSFVEGVEEALERSGLPPARLCLEITETTLMRENVDSLSVLHRLRELGVRIAVDDFGTGYSSMSYLKRFPIDVIKIDRSFINGLPEGVMDQAIVAAIATLGRSTGLEVVAEGVETEAQRDALQKLGVTRLQGWLYARAMPQQELIARLNAGTAMPL